MLGSNYGYVVCHDVTQINSVDLEIRSVRRVSLWIQSIFQSHIEFLILKHRRMLLPFCTPKY